MQSTDEIISFGRSQSIYQNTFTNYEYTKWFGTPNTWELRRPKDGFTIDQKDSFQTKETSTNKPYLDDFYDAVERLNTEEQNFLAYTTVEVLIGAIGAMFSGGLTAWLAAAGVSGPATIAANAMNRARKDAENYYWEVYNRRA